MIATCTHCGAEVRREGLQLVAVADDLAACPDAPMRPCGCGGAGCGSCEGYGEVYGRHAASRPALDNAP